MDATSLTLGEMLDAGSAEALLRNLASECLRRAHGVERPKWRVLYDAIVTAADAAGDLSL